MGIWANGDMEKWKSGEMAISAFLYFSISLWENWLSKTHAGRAEIGLNRLPP